jgi:type III restriction enzyme
VADEAYFTGKVLKTPTGPKSRRRLAKQIYKYLLKNDYVDDEATASPEKYHEAKKAEPGELPPS